MSKKGGFGKFLGGIALGAGLGLLFAPDKGENTRKVLAKKIDELLKKLNDIDLDEVKDELLFRAESLQAELATLDTDKAKELVLEQAEVIREKAEELYKYAIEKGTPVVEKAADDVRKQALKIVSEAEKKLVEANKK
jgi:gas vesicle protein